VILRSIHVSGWRCFADAVEVGPFSDRLTVLHAPNATGKSTLFEALQRGLLDDPTTRGESVEHLRPWGRSLTPTVSILFEHDGAVYRATKTFLDRPPGDRPTALLEQEKSGRFTRIAADRGAVDALRRLLRSVPPGRGLARAENWGLAQVLWAPQDRPHLGRFSGDVITRIRESLGSQAAGAGGSSLERELERAYLQYWTPKGQAKTGKNAGALAPLRDQLTEAVERRTEALQRQHRMEQLGDRLEALRARRRQTSAYEDELRGRVANARSSLRRYEELARERDIAAERLRAGTAAFEGLSTHIERIAKVRKELADTEARTATLAADVPALRSLAGDHAAAAAAARAALEDARAQLRGVGAAQIRAEDARRWHALHDEAGRLSAQVTAIEEAASSVARAREERAALRAPDAAEVAAAQKLTAEIQEHRLRLEAQLITVEIVPAAEGLARVVSGEPCGERRLVPGQPETLRGTPEVVLDIADLGRIRARGPAGDAPALQRRLGDAERKLAALSSAYGTRGVDALQALRERARAMEERIARGEAQLEALLRGRSPEVAKEELRRCEAERADLSARHPEWREERPDADALTETVSRARTSAEAEAGRAEAALAAEQDQERAAREQLMAREADLRTAAARAASLREELDALCADGRTDAEREAERTAVSIAAHAARGQYEEATSNLRQLGDDPTETVLALERQVTAAAEDARESLVEESKQDGELQSLASEGTYSKLAEAEERVAQLQEEIDRESLRAESIRLLRDTVAACRKDAVAAVVRPVEEEATRMLRRIAGGGLGHVRLDDAFAPNRVLPPAAANGATVEIPSLSGGETEQVHLVTRLALARILSGGQRQLVVLDDALTATDAGRFARILTVLEEAAETLQIVALTCHPERYRGLAGATFIDLEQIVAAAGAR
jgi:DNA repair exonuclease SbcCD ATPase subunit